MKKFKNTAFARLFTKFPQIMFANLLFAIPLVIFTTIAVLIGWLTGYNNIVIWCLGIIPAFPLYAGLVMVIRKFAIEKTDVDVTKTFFSAVKENIKYFLIHGIAVYLMIILSTFAIIYYYSLAKTDMTFGGVLTIYIIFTVLLFIMFLYVPIMTVTYELSLKNIYKNAFLLIFGKIIRNIFATLAVLVPGVLITVGVMMTNGIWLIITGILALIIYPLLYSHFSISIISKGLQDTVGSFIPEEKSDKVYIQDFEKEIANKSESDYVFINGKMVKRDK